MTPKEAKAAVLAKWPNAYMLCCDGGLHLITVCESGFAIGQGKTEPEAWLNAYERLKG